MNDLKHKKNLLDARLLVLEDDPAHGEAIRRTFANAGWKSVEIVNSLAAFQQSQKAQIQPVHLQQMLLNLSINARDATGEYGEIGIGLSTLSVENKRCSSCGHFFSGDYAKVSVSDTGTGLSEEIIAKIFDPFFTTKGVGKGSGMGLAVVHGVVHSVRGHIVVDRNASRGSAISIFLPLVKESIEEVAATETIASLSSDRHLAGKCIMVIDDAPYMVVLLEEFLTLQGAKVVAIHDSLEALAAFEKNIDTIDLVITDETMPGITGMDLAKKMLAIRPNLPIILYTGYSLDAAPARLSAIGIAAFFQKPVQMSDLLTKIKVLLADRRASTY